MKILYGVQGTGNGHLARARALTPELRKLGVDVDFIFSGRSKENFFNIDAFADNLKIFRGLTFITEKGKINSLKTIKDNNLFEFISDIKSLDITPYDLVLSDFEPISAWAAKLANKTSIGISHQIAFDHPIPKVQGYTFSKSLMKFFAPSQYKIGFHWHHFNQAILPPLIEPIESKKSIPNKILVYMAFENLDDVIKFLQPFPAYEFHVYAKVEQHSKLEHIHIHPLSHESFHQDLSDCAGVISNCGFELASECLHLGKKLLTKPLSGQFEQLSNAIALEYLQSATVIKTLDTLSLEAWLKEKPKAPINYPNVAKFLAEWIFKGEYDNTDLLVKNLWQDINASSIYNTNFASKILTP